MAQETRIGERPMINGSSPRSTAAGRKRQQPTEVKEGANKETETRKWEGAWWRSDSLLKLKIPGLTLHRKHISAAPG